MYLSGIKLGKFDALKKTIKLCNMRKLKSGRTDYDFCSLKFLVGIYLIL